MTLLGGRTASDDESAQPATHGRSAGGRSRTDETRLQELRETERGLAIARVAAGLFLVAMVATYDLERYPVSVVGWAFTLAGLLVVLSAVALLATRWVHTPTAARTLGQVMLVADGVLLIAFVWLHAFDPRAPHFMVLFAFAAEGAVRFRLRGALATWGVSAVAYLGRARYAEAVHGVPVDVTSAGLRMGILLLVAVALGLFADRLARQADELRAALTGLEGEERWRTALIDMLAHDLRSPLGTAASAVELLQHRGAELDPQQSARLLGSASRQTRQALTLTEELLELARARTGQIDVRRQEVDLGQAITRAVAELSETHDWVEVEVVGDRPALLDAGRVHQILVNLLSNARKYGRPPVGIRAHVEPHVTRLWVTDHGPGLPEHAREAAFEPLTATPGTDSVGLGLWIVRTLARAHGGEVTYGVRDGLPTFEVLLPHSSGPT